MYLIIRMILRFCCCLSSKDTISKAIHNFFNVLNITVLVVAYQAKIQFRKQFTTIINLLLLHWWLLLIKQRYNFESNSQQSMQDIVFVIVVAYQAKIQFRKQFTTKV